MYSSFTIKKDLPEGLKEEDSHLTVSLSYLEKNPPVTWMCRLHSPSVFIEFGLNIERPTLHYLLSRIRGSSSQEPTHKGVGYLKINANNLALEYNNNKLLPVNDGLTSDFGLRLTEDIYDILLDPHEPIENLALQYKEN